MTFSDLITTRVKAFAGAVVAAVVAYVGTAIITSTVITAHGLELAAAGAVLTFLGVHQAPKNQPAPEPHRRARKAAGYGEIGVLLRALIAIALVLLLVWVIFVVVSHLAHVH